MFCKIVIHHTGASHQAGLEMASLGWRKELPEEGGSFSSSDAGCSHSCTRGDRHSTSGTETRGRGTPKNGIIKVGLDE